MAKNKDPRSSGKKNKGNVLAMDINPSAPTGKTGFKKVVLVQDIARAIVGLFSLFVLLSLLTAGYFLFFKPQLNQREGEPTLEQLKSEVTATLTENFRRLGNSILEWEKSSGKKLSSENLREFTSAHPDLPKKDPWGNDYDLSDASEEKGCLIRSLGGDKRKGTGDDLVYGYKKAGLWSALLKKGVGELYSGLEIKLTFPAELGFSSSHLSGLPPSFLEILTESPTEISSDKRTWTFEIKNPISREVFTSFSEASQISSWTGTLALKGLKTAYGGDFSPGSVKVEIQP